MTDPFKAYTGSWEVWTLASTRQLWTGWSHVLPTWPISSRSPFIPVNRQSAKADGVGVDSAKSRVKSWALMDLAGIPGSL